MAQSNVILIKRTTVASKVPTTADIIAGELAANLTDKILYTRDTSNNIISLTGVVSNIAGTGISVSGATGNVTISVNSTVVTGAGNLTTTSSVPYVSASGVLNQDGSLLRISTGQYTLFDTTSGSGVTKLVLRSGAGQSTTNLQEWQNNAGASGVWIPAAGTNVQATAGFIAGGGSGAFSAGYYNASIDLSSVWSVNWANTTAANATKDLSLSRASAGVLQVGDGGQNTNGKIAATSFKYQNAETITLTYANLTTTQTAIDTNDIATYRSVKYLVQASYGSEYQTSEIMLIHNGTSSDITEYAIVHTGLNPLVTFATDISGGNIRLLATAAAGSTTNLTIIKTIINI